MERHGLLYNYDSRASTERKEQPTDHHGSVYEKSEKKDVMVMINPDSKYNKVDVEKKMIVKKNNMKQVQT